MVEMPLGGSETAASSNPTLERQIRPRGGTHVAERYLEKLSRRSVSGRGWETYVDLMMEETAVAEATGAAEELDVRDQGTGQANSLPLDAMKMRPTVEWCTPYH